MELIVKELPPDHDFVLFGDTHEGTILQDKKGMARVRDDILSDVPVPRVALHMGDMAECILVDDKRWARSTDNGQTVIEQYKAVQDYLQPMKDKLVTVLLGNHDWTLMKYGNFTERLCSDLGVQYGSYTCKVSVKAPGGRQMYKLFAAHGWRQLRSTAPDPIMRLAHKKVILKRILREKASDCLVMAMGHTHQLIVAEPESSLYIYDQGSKIKSGYTGGGESKEFIPVDARWYVNTGSFLKLYADRMGVSGYAERMGLDPVELGYVVIECREGKVQNVRKVVVG